MRRISFRLFLLPGLGLAVALAACTSSNIQSEWSCPIDQPEGCFDIPVADDMAISDMSTAGGGDSEASGASITVRRLPAASNSTSSASWTSPGEDDPAAPSTFTMSTGEDGNTPKAPEISKAPVDLTASISGQEISENMQGDGTSPEPVAPSANEGANEGIHEGANEDIGIPSASIDSLASVPSETTFDPLFGLRIPERLAEVWLAPFEDEQGNYHPQTRMVIIVRPASWRLP